MKKLLLALIALVVLAIITANFLPHRPDQILVPPTEPVIATSTISGTFVCLPHRNSSGPQTMECAYGMKADNGSFYALDWSATSVSAFDLPMGRKYSVTGLLVPAEMLNSDHWQIYDIRGIMKVSSYEEIASDMPGFPPNAAAILELNKPVKFGDTVLRVGVVTEDSRCPADVNCIQAGRVRIAVTAESPSGISKTMEIETGQTVTTETMAFTFESVEPGKTTTHKISDGEYRFTFTAKSR